MARIAHAAQIDLRFGDAARELLGFRVSAGPGLHLLLIRLEWNKREG